LATTIDIEQRMNEIRDGSLPETLPSEGYEAETPPAATDPNADPISSTYGAGSTTLDVWALGTGLFGGFPHVNYTAGQGTAGFDYHVAPQWIVGLLGQYTYTSGGITNGNFKTNSGSFGLYRGWYDRQAACWLSCAVLYGFSGYNIEMDGGSASSSGGDLTLYGALGDDFHYGHLIVEPAMSWQYDDITADSYRINNTQFSDTTLSSLISRIGLRISYTYHAGRWLLIPEVNVRWQHEYLQTANNISGVFIDGPSTTVIGAGIDSVAIWGSVGLSAVRVIFSIFSFYSIQAGGNLNPQGVDLECDSTFDDAQTRKESII